MMRGLEHMSCEDRLAWRGEGSRETLEWPFSDQKRPMWEMVRDFLQGHGVMI